jgi:hypothetical protein
VDGKFDEWECAVNQRRLARAHGAFNVLFGLWPLVHMRSFELVSGPKTDDWLVRTVSGLMVANGFTQLTAEPTPAALAQTRLVGIGTAATFAAVDVVYATSGRISKVYLLDALLEAGWIAAWLRGK